MYRMNNKIYNFDFDTVRSKKKKNNNFCKLIIIF